MSVIDQAGPEITSSDIDTLVREHLPLVGYLVSETVGKLPAHVNRDDLTSAGMMALAQAANAYDQSRGVPFSRYAMVRIRGALIDELRSADWASRSVRAKARQRANATEALSASLGRVPTSKEVADYLGLSLAELASIEDDVHRSVVLSIHGFMEVGDLESLLPQGEAGPEQVLVDRERDAYLLDAISALPERLRTVVVGYYFSERQMADLAEELGVTESRVSQMHSEALELLRGGMTTVLSPEQATTPERRDGCVARRKAAYYAAIAAQSDFRARLTAAPSGVARFTGVA